MLFTILIILLIIFLVGGGIGHTQNWGAASWSPLGILLLVGVVLFFTGHLRGC